MRKSHSLRFAALLVCAPAALCSPTGLVSPIVRQEAPSAAETEQSRRESLGAGLSWLAANQSSEGSWNVPANAVVREIGVTALALLAFQADGHSHLTGPYKRVLQAGLTWLCAQQDSETGDLRSPSSSTGMYDHAIATLALLHAEAVESDEKLRDACKVAVMFIMRARNPYGAWRYDVPPLGDNDTSVTSWMILALVAADKAGIPLDREAFAGAINWFDEVTDPATGRVGYDSVGSRSARVAGLNDRFPSDKGEAMTAAALYARLAMGETPADNPMLEEHAKLLLKSRPEPEMPAMESDMYYWFFGSRAMGRMGGDYKKLWNEARDRVLLVRQVKQGPQAGSWDPDGPWGVVGGRAYSTAVGVLAIADEQAASKNDPPKTIERPVTGDVFSEPRLTSALWASRRGESKTLLRTEWGGEDSKQALQSALAWLAAQQGNDGSWNSDGSTTVRIGMTGLAAMALMGDGNSPDHGPYKRSVAAAVDYLQSVQAEDSGLLGERLEHTFHYGHAIGTIAMLEAYQDTKDPELRKSCQSALAYIFKARNPYGVWRYDNPPLGDNDTSISAWMTLAVVHAKNAGFKIDHGALEGMESWLTNVTDNATGRVGYVSKGSASSRIAGINEHYAADASEGMTGAGLLISSLIQPEAKDGALQLRQRTLITSKLPTWGSGGFGVDWTSWFWCTSAMRTGQHEAWGVWNASLKNTLLPKQLSDGSWPSVGAWTYAGGKVQATAFAALCLEAPFRVDIPVSR